MKISTCWDGGGGVWKATLWHTWLAADMCHFLFAQYTTLLKASGGLSLMTLTSGPSACIKTFSARNFLRTKSAASRFGFRRDRSLTNSNPTNMPTPRTSPIVWKTITMSHRFLSRKNMHFYRWKAILHKNSSAQIQLNIILCNNFSLEGAGEYYWSGVSNGCGGKVFVDKVTPIRQGFKTREIHVMSMSRFSTHLQSFFA